MNAADIFQPPVELMRGNVKAAMKTAGATSADLWNVPLDNLIFLDGFNGRVDSPDYQAHVQLITQSIIDNGYYQDKPIAGFVADDGREGAGQIIYVIDGHTRVLAARIAKEQFGAPLTTLPVVIKPKGTTMEDLTVAMIRSNEGRPFTPYETALIVKRLVDMGLTEKVISQRLGISVNYINDLLQLVGAPKLVRDMVVAGEVAATAAIKEVKKHGAKAAPRLKEALAKVLKKPKPKVRPDPLVKGDIANMRHTETGHYYQVKVIAVIGKRLADEEL